MRNYAELTDAGRSRRLGVLARRVLETWPIRVHTVRRVASSFNTIFRVHAAEGDFALRIGPALRIHPVGTEAEEARVLDRLAARGSVRSRIVRTAAGDVTVRYGHPGLPEPRDATLLEWTDGRALPQPVSRATAGELGRLAAELHDQLSDVELTAVSANLLRGDSVLLFDLPDRLGELTTHYGSLFDDARQRADVVLTRLWARSAGRRMLVHGDLGPHNVVRTPEGALAPIDFQDMFVGTVEQDAAISLASLERRDTSGELRASFRAGYRAVRSWPLDDVELERDLVASRHLLFVNLALALRRPGLDEYVARHAAAISRWMLAPTL